MLQLINDLAWALAGLSSRNFDDGSILGHSVNNGEEVMPGFTPVKVLASLNNTKH